LNLGNPSYCNREGEDEETRRREDEHPSRIRDSSLSRKRGQDLSYEIQREKEITIATTATSLFF